MNQKQLDIDGNPRFYDENRKCYHDPYDGTDTQDRIRWIHPLRLGTHRQRSEPSFLDKEEPFDEEED